jgi:hypothetical protein
MCPLMWVAGSLTVRSHETVGADACIEDLRESSQCGPIGVPLVRGSYWVGGTYYGQPIPEQRLDVVTDDVFEALGRGTLLDQEVSSPADGLRLATSVTRYQKGPNNVYRALVTLTNVGSHAVAFPVIDCDPPFRAKIPDPVGPPPTYGAPPGWPYGEGWLQHWHLECPTSFAPTEEWLAPGSSVEAALCFQYWQMGTSWFCAPLEPTFVRQAVTFHMTGFFYDLAVPETTFTIGP